MSVDPQTLLKQLFSTAIEVAQPKHTLLNYLAKIPRNNGRLIVIGAGKASAEMARVVEQNWEGSLEGVVVTRYGYSVPCQKIEIIEAAHPIPDAASLLATEKILAMVNRLTVDDVVLCLISGGGSALLVYPALGITLQDKQSLNQSLLASGASISEMNCVRRHLSQIKGGRLAVACYPAKVITLAISDVPTDHPADVASGPTCGDITTCADAIAIIERYKIPCSPTILACLHNNKNESIKPDDERLKNSEYHLIATPYQSLKAAAAQAEQHGIPCYIFGDSIEGEAKEVAKVFAGITRSIMQHQQPMQRPCLLLSGGETTVTLQGSGSGGRNVEFLLAYAIALGEMPNVYALAGDTDGVDGIAEIAGALLTPDTLKRAWQLKLTPQDYLENNDAHTFFAKLNNQVITGPTLTNVNDFRAIYIR